MPSPSPSPQTIVDTLLGVAAIFITPDWRALILLIPIGLALLFIAWFAFTVRKFATVGPNRRAPARVQPVTPANVHMPGGSSAPILVASGAGALFLGLVLGGVWLWVGVAVLVVTMLAWGREALRDYDHLESTQRLPAVIHEGPPPGVHMPGPSIRPLLGALGSAALLGGLVVGGWVLILAIVFLVYTLIGWLIDATAEYRKTVEADRTGHLENIPARRLPTRTLQVFAVLFVLIGLNQMGVFPPASPASGGTPGASAAPSGGPPIPAGALPVVAKGIAFDVKTLEVAADKPFTLYLENQDPATTPHDIEIRSTSGTKIQGQPPTSGGKATAYQGNALKAGTYTFICSIHPIAGMTGTLTVK
ncbi:MAG: cytochrome c oxidase subunit 4 [Chloroflexi bacterium]|nr:cytochrome c oxidase subunit 4 [Chloroflexota bacterium]